MIRRFARPYARAIVDVAGSAETANALRSELLSFSAAMRDSSELRELYASPAIHMDTKLAEDWIHPVAAPRLLSAACSAT